MRAIDDEEIGRFAIATKHRRDDGDIGQMRASGERIVENDDIALPPGSHGAARRRNAGCQRAQMNRNVRGLGDQFAVAIENRARKIEPFFDVGRKPGALERLAHLFGDAREPVPVKF